MGRVDDLSALARPAWSPSTTEALYARWERWAAKDGCLPLSRIAFGPALDAKGYPADKKTPDRFRHPDMPTGRKGAGR
jgi:hypothetical protein